MRLVLTIALLLFSTSVFSGTSNPLALASVVINAPVSEVWNYVSDSGNAKEWSVYFDHISPLSNSDGAVGSVRRCYRNRNETGIFWDETTVVSQPEKLRVLSISNIHGLVGGLESLHLVSKQVYQALAPNQTRLTFLTYPEDSPHLFQWAEVTLGMHRTNSIFKNNLVNIKAAIEEKRNYQRIFQWQPGLKIF